jgi:hypothetical protein
MDAVPRDTVTALAFTALAHRPWEPHQLTETDMLDGEQYVAIAARAF